MPINDHDKRSRGPDPRRFNPLWIILPVLTALTVSAVLSVPAVYFGRVYFHELQVQVAHHAPDAADPHQSVQNQGHGGRTAS